METLRDPRTDHFDLATALAHERRLLELLRFHHLQLRVLLEADESRFLGRAIDELGDITVELDAVEEARAAVAAAVAAAHGLPEDSRLIDLIQVSPEAQATLLDELRKDMRRLVDEIERERRSARALSHEQVRAVARRLHARHHRP